MILRRILDNLAPIKKVHYPDDITHLLWVDSISQWMQRTRMHRSMFKRTLLKPCGQTPRDDGTTISLHRDLLPLGSMELWGLHQLRFLTSARNNRDSSLLIFSRSISDVPNSVRCRGLQFYPSMTSARTFHES